MNGSKKNITLSLVLLISFIIYTLLIKFVDVSCDAVNNSCIGFSTINMRVFEFLGTSDLWYNISDYLGILAILIVGVYALIGLVQLIKRKSLFKVDKEIISLGVLYVIVFGLYILFENLIINYRPVLIDGVLEASYPSSHTLLALTILLSAVVVNKKLFNKTFIKVLNILLILIALVIVIGRLLSGVHWLTDIIGSIILSAFLLKSFIAVNEIIKNKLNK